MEPNSPSLSTEATAALIKRQTHDLRNFLNGMEMELTLLTETTDEAEKLAAIQRLRHGARAADAMIRAFAAKFTSECANLICTSDIAEQWMSDARHMLPESSIEWKVNAGRSVTHVRAALLRSVLSDVLSLVARTHPNRKLEASCTHTSSQVIFQVSCPTADSDRRELSEPLVWSALQQLAARDNGQLERHTPPHASRVVFSLTFPLSSPE